MGAHHSKPHSVAGGLSTTRRRPSAFFAGFIVRIFSEKRTFIDKRRFFAVSGSGKVIGPESTTLLERLAGLRLCITMTLWYQCRGALTVCYRLKTVADSLQSIGVL